MQKKDVKQPSNTMPKVPGYKLLHPLGTGSDAQVFAAKCLKTGMLVALKVIEKNKQSKEGLQRTKQEIKLLSELDHPNIIKIYEAFDQKNKRFIVTEYAARGDLFEALYGTESNPSQTVMKEGKARRIFIQVLSAIRYCHRNGIVHRDIKPENIFLDSRGNVKLGDFGLAMRYTPGKSISQPVGSLLYASPEVLQHQPYEGPELDVWGLGVLLYEMLCGTPPFTADSEQETCDKILRGDYAIPKYLSPDAQCLISSMIKISKLRATVSEIMQHPWCSEEYSKMEGSYRRKRKGRESGEMTPGKKATKVEDKKKKTKRGGKGEMESGEHAPCFAKGDCAMWSPGSVRTQPPRGGSVRVKARREVEYSDEEKEGDGRKNGRRSVDSTTSDDDSDSDSEEDDGSGEEEEEQEQEEEDGYSTDESGSEILISPRGGNTPEPQKDSSNLHPDLLKAFKLCRLDIPEKKNFPPTALSKKKTVGGRCLLADSKSPRSASSPALNC